MFTNEDLKKVINYESIGSFFPYQGGTDNDIENYIKTIVADLNRSSLIAIEADYSMYGSGYASYVDLFCYKKDGSSTTQKGSVYYTKGISIYICRLAPVAVLGKEERSKHSHGGSFGFLHPDKIGSTPEGDWQAIVETLQRKLGSYNISMLDKNYVSRELPFEAKIPTILDEGTYKIFDAFFYWED